MKFCDKLIQLRREKGYSQEQLADLLKVSRQSVSKWEAGQSMPELNKLIVLADLFGSTVDYLVKEDLEPGQESQIGKKDTPTVQYQPVYVPRYFGEFEYKSKRTVFGIPLIHIRYGYGPRVAKGIIAIGNISIGVISIGGVALGGICLGGFSLGLLALAGCAIGLFAFGGLAIGILAVGGFAFGVYSIGGMSVASQIAVGGSASAKTAIGGRVSGEYILKVTETISSNQIREFILLHHPNIWEPILRILSVFGGLF